MSEKVQQYCEKLKSKKIKKCYESKTIKAAYLGKNVKVSKHFSNINRMSKDKTFCYNRMIKDSCLYMSCLIINAHSCNSYAQLSDKSFIKIVKFVVDTENLIEKTVCKKIDVFSLKDCPSIFEVSKIHADDTLIDTASIHRVCVFLPVSKTISIIPVPHLFYY